MKTRAKAVRPALTLAPVIQFRKAPPPEGAIIYQDCINFLREMLREAERGDLIGFAFVAMYKDKYYVTDTAGEAHKNPEFTSGMLASLNYQLMQEVEKRMT